MQRGTRQFERASVKDRPSTNMCSVLGKRISRAFFMLDQRTYLVFQVRSHPPLLHMLVGKGPFWSMEIWVGVLHKCTALSLEILLLNNIHYFFPLRIWETKWPLREFCQSLHRDLYLFSSSISSSTVSVTHSQPWSIPSEKNNSHVYTFWVKDDEISLDETSRGLA